jgi:hypothetical protein
MKFTYSSVPSWLRVLALPLTILVMFVDTWRTKERIIKEAYSHGILYVIDWQKNLATS